MENFKYAICNKGECVESNDHSFYCSCKMGMRSHNFVSNGMFTYCNMKNKIWIIISTLLLLACGFMPAKHCQSYHCQSLKSARLPSRHPCVSPFFTEAWHENIMDSNPYKPGELW